jgi:hypothetical protein
MYFLYIKLIENSAIINPLNKKDQLLIIDPKLLIWSDNDTISTNNSNDHNPITSNNNNLIFFNEENEFKSLLTLSVYSPCIGVIFDTYSKISTGISTCDFAFQLHF